MRDDDRDEPGPAVGGYRIERLIGVGGAATVYEARRLGPDGPGERVACKVLHAERRSGWHRELLRREAVLGLRATPGHPGLVEIFDFFDDAEAQLCIAMELVDGASVAELCAPDRRLPVPVVRRIACEVLDALVYLHQRGVLHRDLSLGNVLVTSGGAVKVADLGIAREMRDGLVHTVHVRGTPMYLSSEAIHLLPLDARADLFSLGAVLYELVTGAPPCGHQAMLGQVFARNVIGRFAPLPPDTPPDLAELITGLIRADRDARRPQTAAEGLALLRDQGHPVASPAALAELVADAQPRREQVLAGRRPAHVLPAGYVLMSRDARDARPAERAADAPPDGARLALPGPVDDDAGAPAHDDDEPELDAVPDYVLDAQAEALLDYLALLMAGLGADGALDPMDESAERIIDVSFADEHVEGLADEPPAASAHVEDAASARADERTEDAVREPVAGDAAGHVAEHARGGTRPAGVRRRAARRAFAVAAIAAIGVSMVVLALSSDHGAREEAAPIEPELPSEVTRPVIPPRLPPPVAPTHDAPDEPRAEARADELRERQIERRRRTGSTRSRREYVPAGDEPPPWGRR